MNDGSLTREGIRIHQPGDFAGMHKAGALAAQILDEVAADDIAAHAETAEAAE